MKTYKLGDVLAKVKRPGKLKATEYQAEGDFPVIDQGEGQIAGYTDIADIVLTEPLPIVVFGDHTRRVKLAREPFVCGADGTQLLYPNTPDLDPHFFYYAIKNIDLSNYFYARHFKFLKDQEFQAPELPTQRRIVETLSAYDDLIENNRRRIALLEDAARQLYKEWFVRLRFPGHEHVKMVDGVPEGWTRAHFPDVIDFKEGPGLRNYQYREEGIPFLNIRTLGNGDIDLSKTQFLDPNEVESRYRKFLVEENDHVVSSSGTLGRVSTVRKCHLPLCLNTSIIRMRPKGGMGLWFLRAYLSHGDFLEQATAMATGAAQLNFGPSHLKQMNVLVPDSKMAERAEAELAPIYEQIKLMHDQMRCLERARDLLLPKLMNGTLTA